MQDQASDQGDSQYTQALAAVPDNRTPEILLKGLRAKFPGLADAPDDVVIKGWATLHPEAADIAYTHFDSKGDKTTAQKFAGMLSPQESTYYNAERQQMENPQKPQEEPKSIMDQAIQSGVDTIKNLNVPGNPYQAVKLQDTLNRGYSAAESLVTGQGLKGAVDSYNNPVPGKFGGVEADALDQIGIKNEGVKTVLGGLLGTALDAAPITLTEAIRTNIANGNMGAAEFHIKKILGIPQETSLVNLTPEQLQESKYLGKALRNNTELKAQFAAKVGEGTGENQVKQPTETWYHGGQPGLTTLDEGMVTKFQDEAQRYANQQPGGIVYKVDNPETLNKVTQKDLGGNVSGDLNNIRSSGKGTKVSPIIGNESGQVNPQVIAQLPGAMVKAASDYIAKVNQPFVSAGTLEDNFNTLQTQNKETEQRGIQLINQINASPSDAIAIYHHIENPSEPVTPVQQAQLKALDVVREDRQKLFEKLRTNGIPVENENYTPRNAVGKGGVIDRIEQGAKSGAKDLLSQSSPNFKKRVMMSLEDENGKRQVVSIKEGQVTGITNKVSTEMGKYDLTKNIDLLKKDISPIQDRLAKLKRTMDILDSVKTRPSVPQSRINMLRNKVADLGSGLMDSVKKGENIDKYLSKRTAKRVSDALLELKAYARVQPTENVVLRDRRMATLRDKITTAEALINATIDSYDLGKMEDKVFVDNTGKKWSVKQATTKEIEKHTNQKYYKNAIVNEVLAHNRLQQVDRAVSFLENYKTSPEFANVAQSLEGGTPINKDWRMTKWQQFRGYAFEPHTADVLDRFYDEMHRGQDPLQVLTNVNKFMRDVIFFNPSIHVPNVVYHWFTERGLKSFVNPLEYPRLAKTMARAIKAIVTTNEDYLRIMHASGNLQYVGLKGGLVDLMQKKAYIELSQDKALLANVAKAMGYANPLKLLQTISGHVTWFTNDVLTVQSILEHESNGMSLEEAVKETAKGIPNYRVPTHVLKMKWLSHAMRNQNITIFGAYHYGAMKAHGEIAKGLASGKAGKTGDSLNKIAAIAFLAFVLKPVLDEFAKKISGNKNAESRWAGSLTAPKAAYDLMKGTKDFSDVLSLVMTPAIGTKTLVETIMNHEIRPGFPKIRHAGSQLEDEAGHIGRNLAPISTASQLIQGSKTPQELGAGFLAINTPRYTPEERKLKDMIGEDKKYAYFKALRIKASGDKEGSKKVVSDYNNRLLDMIKKTYESKELKVPSDNQIYRTYNKLFIRDIKQRTVNKYESKQDMETLHKLAKRNRI